MTKLPILGYWYTPCLHPESGAVHSPALSLAGLHAKGFTHLDIKPSNFLVFGDRIKLGDVDGCVAIGAPACIEDGTVSYSQLYCAPEWARFVARSSRMRLGRCSIEAAPELDSWSVGATLVELVMLDSFFRDAWKAASLREQGGAAEFMPWLANLQQQELSLAGPGDVDGNFLDLAAKFLTVDSSRRVTPLSCVRHPFFVEPSTGSSLDVRDVRDCYRSQLLTLLSPCYSHVHFVSI